MSSQIDSTSERLVREGNVFRNTHTHSGRKVVITPQNSSMQHLCYARTRLDSTTPEVNVNTGNSETAMICISGEAEFTEVETNFSLGSHAPPYIPKLAKQ